MVPKGSKMPYLKGLYTPLSSEKTLLGQMHTSVGQMHTLVGQMHTTKFGQMQISRSMHTITQLFR